jgi:hypothetical protein
VNIVNGLDWRTDARGSFDRQRLSGALANPFVTSSSRLSKRDRKRKRRFLVEATIS